MSLKKYEKKIVSIGLLIIIFLILLTYFIFKFVINITLITPNKNNTIPDSQNPPARIIAPQVSLSQKNQLKIVSAYPPESVSISLPPVAYLEFKLNDIINPKTFFYNVTPHVETYIQTNGDTVIIYAKDIWKPGITTITIYGETTGARGRKLNQPFIYKFKTEIPEDAPDENGTL